MLLPVSSFKSQIQKAVLEHKYTLISSEAGGGKSTLVPQYLMNSFKKVIVTNPRVISAITLAQYVAEEMGVVLGEAVGYRTGYYKCASRDTAVEYCTDGLQLIRAIFSEDTDTEKVLIIDEVHEWTNQTEALVAWCKLVADEWNTKVVIMSATMETEEIATYLGKNTCIINVPGKTYNVVTELRSKWDFEKTIREEIALGHNVLAFVAKKSQVRDMIEKLEGENAEILPLHGELEYHEQRRCFYNYPRPKVIISTPIAQTSVTIPGIDTVVDTGKAIIPTAKNGVMFFDELDVSQADLKQRMKRAGRTKDGKYILCSNVSFEDRPEYPVPEIQRSFLDQTVLQFASMRIDAEKMEFFHQPDEEAIIEAKKKLEALGCMNDNGEVTEIGHKVAQIPMPTDKARMIVEAEKYGVTAQVATICAIIDMGGLLQKNSKIGVGSYQTFTKESESDLLAELDVWNKLNELNEQSKLTRDDFKRLGINRYNYYQAKKHLQRICAALDIDGVIESTSKSDRDAIIKSVLAGMPEIYVQSIWTSNEYLTTGGFRRKLDNKSCVSQEAFLAGYPITVTGKDRFGFDTEFYLLTFATIVPEEIVLERFAGELEYRTDTKYDPAQDAVKVTVTTYYNDRFVTENVSFEHDHPEYQELKAKYEEQLRREAEVQRIYEQNRRRREAEAQMWQEEQRRLQEERIAREARIAAKQQQVCLGGELFNVRYDRRTEMPYIYMRQGDAFTIKENEIVLDNGEIATIIDNLTGREFKNLDAFRKFSEAESIKEAKNWIRIRCKGSIDSINALLYQSDLLKEYSETINCMGEKLSFEPIYVCARLSGNNVRLVIEEDKAVADASTQEALEYIFKAEFEREYPASKFSHQTGKRKKFLTDSEKSMKLEFDSLVRELACGLTIENLEENAQFLKEYYHEMMSRPE